MSAEKTCPAHAETEWRVGDLERRMGRVETFILSALILMATASGFTAYQINTIPDKINQQRITYEQQRTNTIR